ncbi:TPA: hypothetical protein ACH3X3_012233 [Trebouxia sp. C0006]
MVLSLLQSPARCLARHQLCCSRTDRCRSHYQATSSHSTGAADPSKLSRKRSQAGVTSAGSALSSLTIQPLQRSSKTSEQPWSSGILCTGENCSYKADPRTVAWLKDLFNDLDSNGDGAITKGDLKSLMRQTNSYLEPVALDWLSEAELGDTFDNYDADHSGDISFNEFEHMYNDGSVLAVTLAKYKLMFDEVDTSGNGTLGAAEVQHFFQKIGQPFSGPQELHQLFSKYDTNHSGQLEFNEFLVLFKDKLQDLQKVLEFISLKPAKSKSTEASVLERFAGVYKKVVFLHFYAESNEMTKYLDEVKLKVECHPHFAFFRNGHQDFWFTGANAENFESYIQQQTTAEENPATGLSMFARRAHRAKVGLTRS